MKYCVFIFCLVLLSPQAEGSSGPYSIYHGLQWSSPFVYESGEADVVTGLVDAGFIFLNTDEASDKQLSELTQQDYRMLLGVALSSKFAVGLGIGHLDLKTDSSGDLDLPKSGIYSPEFWAKYSFLSKKKLSLDFSASAMPKYSTPEEDEVMASDNVFAAGLTLNWHKFKDDFVDESYKFHLSATAFPQVMHDYWEESTNEKVSRAIGYGASFSFQKSLSSVLVGGGAAYYIELGDYIDRDSLRGFIGLGLPISEFSLLFLDFAMGRSQFDEVYKDVDSPEEMAFSDEYSFNELRLRWSFYL